MENIHSPLQNKMTYIATFYSRYGAIRFKKQCEAKKMAAKMMPVPRNLSSSCGTCVRFESEQPYVVEDVTEEMEQIVLVLDEKYELLYQAEESLR